MNHDDFCQQATEAYALALAFSRLADDGNPHFPDEREPRYEIAHPQDSDEEQP